jgi:tol-pal system protein YbgF
MTMRRKSLSILLCTPLLALTAGHASAAGLMPRLEVRPASPVVAVQVVDPNVLALQEQIRALTGKVEQLTFDLLQMQDQLRRMQEDNEFRFKELEEQKRGDAGDLGIKQDRDVAAAPAAQDEVATLLNNDGGSAELGAPPQVLGTVRFDAQGNPIVDGVVAGQGAPMDLGASEIKSDPAIVAALPPTDNPGELYRSAYELILTGDYRQAEAAFQEHMARFPDDAQAEDAHYWLGEAQLGQGKFQEAAETFLATRQSFPDGAKAPDTLFKLGVSLAGMGNRDLACATFADVVKRYPDASTALSERVQSERSKAQC